MRFALLSARFLEPSGLPTTAEGLNHVVRIRVHSWFLFAGLVLRPQARSRSG